MAKRRRISRTRAVPVDDAPTPSPSISASEHAQRQPNCVEALYPCRHILLQHMDSETRASWRLTCKQAAADVYEATTCLTWAKGEPTVCDILPRDLFEVAMQLLLPLELIKPKQPGPRTLALLSKLPGLEQLTCAVAPLRLNGLHQGIRKLDLGYCGELSSFVPVRACSALQSLRLHGAKHDAVQHRKSSTLAAVIKSLTTLTELTFDRCMWRRCAGEALGPAIGCLTLLQRLTIRAQLGSEGAIVLAPFIGRLHNLRALCLPSTGICAPGVTALSRHITNLSHLQELDLKSAYVSEGIGPLSIALGSFTGLTSLDIGDGFISDIGARALASGHLSRLTRLQTLGLRSNALGPMGLQALVPAFANALTGLRCLELRDNYLAGDAADVLVVALEPLTRLTRLDLSANLLSSRCMQQLQPLLTMHLTLLQELSVSRAVIGEVGATALSATIEGLARSLRLVDASGAHLGLTDKGRRRVLAAAAAVPGLQLFL